MARKQVKRPAEAPKLVKVTYRGESYPEYQGKSFSVPAGSANPGRLVEQQIAAEVAAKAAEEAAAAAQAAKDSADQAMLAERIEQVKAEPEVVVEEQVVEAPAASGDQALSLAASLANVQAALLVQSREVESLQSSLAQTVTTVAEQLALVQSEGISREQAVALIKNNVEMMNGSFNSFAETLNGFQEQLNQQRVDIDVAAQAISDSREIVDQARRVKENTEGFVRSQLNAVAEEIADDNAAFMTAVLMALGLDASTLNMALNRTSVDPGALMITRNFLAQAAAISKKWSEATGDTLVDIKEADKIAIENFPTEFGV